MHKIPCRSEEYSKPGVIAGNHNIWLKRGMQISALDVQKHPCSYLLAMVTFYSKCQPS